MIHALQQPGPEPGPREVWIAPTWRRAVALLLEFTPCALAALFVGSWLQWIDWSRIPPDPRWNAFDALVDTLNDQGMGIAKVAAASLAFLFVQGVFFEALFRTSPSKRLMGLTLIDISGARPALWRILLRQALRVPSIAVLGVGCGWAAVDRHRRALHDGLSGVYVELTSS
jgi:uncharacterized RDD family membrane protein YckC